MTDDTPKKTIDMADNLADLREDLGTVESELESVRTEAESADDPGEYDALEDEFESLQDLAEELDRKIGEWEDLVDTAREEWGGTEFTIRQFHWGHRNQIDDLVREDAAQKEVADQSALMGSVKARTVQVGVTRTPSDAPSKPRDYPPTVGEWLYQEISAYNERGETNFTRSSLRDSVTPPSDSLPN